MKYYDMPKPYISKKYEPFIKYINNNDNNQLNIKNKISNSPQNQINYTYSNTSPKIINCKNIKQKENIIFYLVKKKDRTILYEILQSNKK